MTTELHRVVVTVWPGSLLVFLSTLWHWIKKGKTGNVHEREVRTSGQCDMATL